MRVPATGTIGTMPSPTVEIDSAAASERFREDFQRLRTQIGTVVVGQDGTVEAALISLFCGGHLLLEGVPGIGKTLLVRTIASALSLSFGRVQFTPDLMPADISGTTVVDEVESATGGRSRSFRFQPGPLFTQILLADEVNRATPKTQSALLEAMQERSVTVAGTSHQLPAPFLVMATQNPIEQEGTYPLPEAQLDRFFFKVIVPQPSRKELHQIIDRTTGHSGATASSVLDAPTILSHQQLVRRVIITPSVQDFAVRMVLSTHPDSELASPMVRQYARLGASPRAAQSLILAAKCRALIEGRAAASVEDLRSVALHCLRHRLILNFEASASGVTADAIVANLLQTLPVEMAMEV